ncbi:hypothetical protein SAMN05216276_1003263 [Streptosporangium subroseum]|uniref:Uncharacterized protein n=1 Tax=Streptosporangium subroseum TaxID=106412 RepID=A0A239BIJ5_9ACTN|nr:hypothetical protein [Streptosporangium subroseum]SNS07977.1 hypothetical protein SAMN05216276_1003263 [Streptosporangium subroseum]
MINRSRFQAVMEHEQEQFTARNPASRPAFGAAELSIRDAVKELVGR